MTGLMQLLKIAVRRRMSETNLGTLRKICINKNKSLNQSLTYQLETFTKYQKALITKNNLLKN